MACGLCAFRMENEDINEQTCINSGWMPKPLGCLCVRVYASAFDDLRFALKQKTEAATISRSTMFFCPGNNTNSMQPSMHRKITVTI